MSEPQNDLFDQVELDPSILEHVNGCMDDTHAWPSLLLELHDVLAHELKQKGIESPTIPLELVLAIGQHMGGFQVYIPRGDALRQQIRDMQIYNEFNGRNIKFLAKKHHVTYKTIYEIIARIRKIEIKKRQLDMFG